MTLTYPLDKLPPWAQLTLFVFLVLLIVLGVIDGLTKKADE